MMASVTSPASPNASNSRHTFMPLAGAITHVISPSTIHTAPFAPMALATSIT